MKKLYMLFILSTLLISNVIAEGYQVNSQGNRNSGMAHTGTALLLGPEAIHFNPGALSMLPQGFAFSGGINFVISKTVFHSLSPSVYEAETDNPFGTPMYFYGSASINEKLAVGLGFNTPYGNTLKWNDDWRGRYLIQNISLKTLSFQPTISYKIHDKISFGAGLIIAQNIVELNKALPLESSDGEGSVKIEGQDITIGGNFGVFIKPIEKLNIGISYRTSMKANVKGGDASFDVPSALSSYFPAENKYDAQLPYPENINFGIAYQFTPKLLVSADINMVKWSIYDSLNFDFETNTDKLQDSYNPRLYKNTMIYRLGIQYEINERITVRTGAYFDETPIQDDYMNPETPGANKIGISGGLSIVPVKNLSVDLSFLYLNAEKRESTYTPANFGGNYYTSAILPGIGISYKIPKGNVAE